MMTENLRQRLVTRAATQRENIDGHSEQDDLMAAAYYIADLEAKLEGQKIRTEARTALADQPQQSERGDGFAVGDKVRKTKGYPFPGKIVAAFDALGDKRRYVVECTVPEVEGCLHIFNADQLQADTR